MKYTVILLAVAAAGLVGCASSSNPNQPVQGPAIVEPSGAETTTTNAVDPAARDVNQQPIWHNFNSPN